MLVAVHPAALLTSLTRKLCGLVRAGPHSTIALISARYQLLDFMQPGPSPES